MCSEHQPKPHQLFFESNICNLKSAGKEKQPLVQRPQLSTCPFLCCHELSSWMFPKFLSIPPESRMKKKKALSHNLDLLKKVNPPKKINGRGWNWSSGASWPPLAACGVVYLFPVSLFQDFYDFFKAWKLLLWPGRSFPPSFQPLLSLCAATKLQGMTQLQKANRE